MVSNGYVELNNIGHVLYFAAVGYIYHGYVFII